MMFGFQRCSVVAAFLIALSGAATSAATEEGERFIVPPFGPLKLEGKLAPVRLYAHSGPNYFSGSYQYVIPLTLPPARNGLVPAIQLQYDSTAGLTAFGRGWDLNLPRIVRSQSLGIPSYDGPGEDYERDRFEFNIGGQNGILVPVRRIGNEVLYRPKFTSGKPWRPRVVQYLFSLRHDRDGPRTGDRSSR